MSTSITRLFNSSTVSLLTAVDLSCTTQLTLFRPLLFAFFILSLSIAGAEEVSATEPSSDAKVFQFQGPDNLRITGTLSSPSYENGDTAIVSLKLPSETVDNTGSKLNPISILAKISDGSIECSSAQIVILSKEVNQDLPFPITTACPHPEIMLTFFDEKGVALDPTVFSNADANIDTSLPISDTPLTNSVTPTSTAEEGMSNTTKSIIVLTTLSALVLLLALIRIRRKV
jgi:hypothetical protein